MRYSDEKQVSEYIVESLSWEFGNASRKGQSNCICYWIMKGICLPMPISPMA